MYNYSVNTDGSGKQNWICLFDPIGMITVRKPGPELWIRVCEILTAI